MPNFISIFLSLLILGQSIGAIVILNINQALIRAEIKQQIKKSIPLDELFLLKITKSEKNNTSLFQQIHEREFRYQGNMYDVIRQENIGDTTFYHCISDVKETRLLANIDRLVRERIRQSPNRRASIRKLLQLFDGLFPALEQNKASTFFARQHPAALWHYPLRAWLSPPAIPPPEFET